MVFIVIRYGEGKEALANPDCDAMNLLDYVAFKCGWNRKDAKNNPHALDLCDANGNLKGLHKMGINNTRFYLPEKEKFVPVIIDQEEMNARLFVQSAELLLSEEDPTAIHIKGTWQQLLTKNRRESSVDRKIRSSMGSKKSGLQKQSSQLNADHHPGSKSPTKRKR